MTPSGIEGGDRGLDWEKKTRGRRFGGKRRSSDAPSNCMEEGQKGVGEMRNIVYLSISQWWKYMVGDGYDCTLGT
mgnify:CR=1 FL=1